MQNEIWNEISTFLNDLRCGEVSRESYVQLSEMGDARKKWCIAKEKLLSEENGMDSGQRGTIEEYTDSSEHLSFESYLCFRRSEDGTVSERT
ncbi:MAG: hypothetical protein LUF27_17065 [Lachnospiraceae bacterium]|nr:hypothetical protein [Lachnospiraceae bacterium]